MDKPNTSSGEGLFFFTTVMASTTDDDSRAVQLVLFCDKQAHPDPFSEMINISIPNWYSHMRVPGYTKFTQRLGKRILNYSL